MWDWYIVGQCLGGVAIVLGFVSFQMRTQRQLLSVQLLTCLVFCAHYLMIGAIAGMAMNAVCVFRNVAFYYRNQKGWHEPWIPLAFGVLQAIVGILAWGEWYSVFLFFGLVINTLCMSFSNPQSVRKSILVTSPLVLVYNAFTLSIGGLVFESVSIISAVIGIVRYKTVKREGISGKE